MDKKGFSLLNFSHKIHKGNALKDDPYILLSQAHQVFYVEDEKDKGWTNAVGVKPRDGCQLGATIANKDECILNVCLLIYQKRTHSKI